MPLDIALTDAGYNQRIGRYGFARDTSGEALFDETQAYAVMSSIAEIKGGWWADSTHGSTVAAARNATRFTPSTTPSQAQASALDALVPLQRANLIAASPTATASLVPALGGLQKLQLAVSWAIPGGAKQTKKIGI